MISDFSTFSFEDVDSYDCSDEFEKFQRTNNLQNWTAAVELQGIMINQSFLME